MIVGSVRLNSNIKENKMNAMKTTLMGLTAAAVLGVSAMAVAETKPAPQQRPQLTEQQKAQMAQRHFDRRYGDLKLSKSQQSKIQAIEEQYRPQARAQISDAERQAFAANADKMRQARLNVVQGKTFNEAEAQQVFAQEQAVRNEMQQKHQQQRAQGELNQLRKEHAIFQVLDKKQQQQYLERAKQPRPMMARDGGKGMKGKPHHRGHGPRPAAKLEAATPAK
jgi:cell division protein FtsL